MRHERDKHVPALPATIADITLTDAVKQLSGSDFVFKEGDIVYMAKDPTLKLLEGNNI